MADFWQVPYNTWGNVYINLNGRPVAKYVGTGAYFFHASALGSTSMITDWGGSVRQKEIFYPYGQFWAYGGYVNSFRFAALREVMPFNESEVFMSQTRDHHSRLYRWMTPDPLAGDIMNPQSLNRYAYVMNNPVNFVDPTGLGCENSPINGYTTECYPGRPPDYSGGGGGGWGYAPNCDSIQYATTNAECGDMPAGPWNPFPIGPIFGGGGGGGGGGTSAGGGGGGGTGNVCYDYGCPDGSVFGGETLGIPAGLNIPGPSLGDFLGIPRSAQWCGFRPCADPGLIGNAWDAAPKESKSSLRWRQFKDKVGLALCGDTPGQGREQVDEHLIYHAGIGATIGAGVGIFAGSPGGFPGMAIGAANGMVYGAAAGATISYGIYRVCKASGRYDQHLGD